MERIIIIEDSGNEDLIERFLLKMKGKVRLDSSLEMPDGKALVFEKKFGEDLHDMKILIRHRGKISIMKTADIIRMESMDEKSVVYLQDGVTVECPEILNDLDEETADGFFFRAHPGHLINLNFMSKILLGSMPSIEMSDGFIVPLQGGKQSELLKYFEKYIH